ncbi:MAG: 30S ribosomal protein S17 [Rickettsiales bacterium]|nr:MAG: 30S ribosomal protein S17 [Rickettsiales bacterium]
MPKRILQGTVVSAKSEKTVSVEVERRFRHPLYKKTVRKSTKYAVHDENSRCSEGDKVKIQECRPLSKTKSWVIVEE